MRRRATNTHPPAGRLVVCLLAATAAYLASAYPLMLNVPAEPEPAPRPPLRAAVEPSPRRLVWVLLDGLRLDASRGMAALNRLRADGMDVEARAAFPTFSLTNFIVQASGLDPDASGVRANGHVQEVRLDSIFRCAKEAGLRTAVVSTEDPVYGLPYASWIDEQGLADRPEELPAGGLVLVHLDGIDEAGHRAGAASRAYRRAVRRADAVLDAIAGRLDAARDTLVVTSDHGHTDRGGHGGAEPEVVAIPIVLWGAGIPAGVRRTGASARDVGPTIAALLGVPPLRHASGHPLVGGHAAGSAPGGRRAARPPGPGLRFLLLPGGVLLVATVLAAVARRSRAGRREWLVSPTYMLSFAALYWWGADTLSFSTIDTAEEFGLRVLGIGVLAGAAQLAAGRRASLAPAAVVASLAALTALVAAPGPIIPLSSAELCFLPIPTLSALAIACAWMALAPAARPPHGPMSAVRRRRA